MLHTLIQENVARRNETTANAASITTLQAAADASLTTITDCGAQGMIFGRGHTTANSNDCIPSLQVANDGRVSLQGGMKFGDYALCDPTTAGTLRYNAAAKRMEFCNGSIWGMLGGNMGCAINFPAVSNADLDTYYDTTDAIYSAETATASVAGATPATIRRNGANTGMSSGVTINQGNSVGIRGRSASLFNQTANFTLDIGAYTACWQITTKQQDVSPNSFTFTDLTGQELSTLVSSNSVTVSGFDGPLTVSVSGQGNPQLKIGSGAWTTSGEINPGQSLTLRLTTSPDYETQWSASLVVGTLTVLWHVTTKTNITCSYIWGTGDGTTPTYGNSIYSCQDYGPWAPSNSCLYCPNGNPSWNWAWACREHCTDGTSHWENGYEHWIWDDRRYPPRPIQGFLKKDELELAIQRRSTRKPLAPEDINSKIVERYYQTRAIRRVAEAFEKDNLRKALLVMATGSGKTRTVIALSDLLMRANWARRILFLADRVALVNQASNAFKAFLPQASPVNLVTDKAAHGRVYVSTYPTMMGLIDETKSGVRRFGPGHFDLIVIDEAHRSVYRKYKSIFDYFDSLLVGLTATPKDEVDRDTYALFDLERGIPTDAYGLDEAVSDGFLVPPRAVSVTLKFQREGIKYDDLSEEEKEAWDAIEWDEDGAIPDRVEAAAVNKRLFNEDTVDKVLEHVMTHGLKVADGDRLGKTIVFAKNHDHAQFITERFDANYPHLQGRFARVIDFKTEYAQSLIDDFSSADKEPHIAISVDMLDTGIDIPEVVNLVFFKIVRSKTKFWQMIGRGTRLCPDLFGIGQHKEYFYVFDFCQNFEFFNQNPDLSEGSSGASLSERLFAARVELVGELDRHGHPDGDDPAAVLRRDIVAQLRAEVDGMNVENFIVRPKRRVVEKYRADDVWSKLGLDERTELIDHIAGLPSALVDDDISAKQFDYLILQTQLAVLRAEKVFSGHKKRIVDLASALEELGNVPMVAAEMAFILEIQTDEFWQDVTPPMLETIRRRLRSLIKLIELRKRPHVYTDFEDEIGGPTEVELQGVAVGTDMHRFRMKARHFLKEHENHIAIQKVRRNEPLTAQDLAELERIFIEAAVAAPEDLERVRIDGGLGIFVRSLVGLDREAAKHAFDQFQCQRTLSANQIEFLNMVIDYLTERGVMDPRLLYESPFTDFDAMGVEGVFDNAGVVELIGILEEVRRRAAA